MTLLVRPTCLIWKMGPVTAPLRQVYVGYLHTRDLEVTSGSDPALLPDGLELLAFLELLPRARVAAPGLSGHFGALVSSGMAVCVVQPGTEAPPGGAQGHIARVRSRRGSDLSVSDISGLLAGARPRRPAPALRSRDLEPGAERGLSPSFSPVGPPCRASSRTVPSTSTSTSPRAASTQTPGRRPCTAGSPPSTCHGVSTPNARPTRAGRNPSRWGGGLGWAGQLQPGADGGGVREQVGKGTFDSRDGLPRRGGQGEGGAGFCPLPGLVGADVPEWSVREQQSKQAEAGRTLGAHLLRGVCNRANGSCANALPFGGPVGWCLAPRVFSGECAVRAMRLDEAPPLPVPILAGQPSGAGCSPEESRLCG